MKKANLGQIASNSDSRRLIARAVEISRQTNSAEISGSDTIIEIPYWAKGVKGVSGRSHFEAACMNGHRTIPKKARFVQYPEYEKHGSRYIYYGPITYYDQKGHPIEYSTESN